MPYYQRVQIMGVTGAAAELKFNEQGQPRTHFSVFVEEAWRDKVSGDRKKLTTIFRCTAFNAMAQSAARVLGKGTWIFVEGRMRCRAVEGREFWSVTVDAFRRLERNEPEDESQAPEHDDP